MTTTPTTSGPVEVPTDAAHEAGFLIPVALTQAAHADCVAWTDADTARTGSIQEEATRLYDVLAMAAHAVRRAPFGTPVRMPFRVCRVARTARPGEDGDIEPDEVPLVFTLHRDGHGPRAVICLPTEG